MSGLKKGDHYCAPIHQHHHVHFPVCVCVCVCVSVQLHVSLYFQACLIFSYIQLVYFTFCMMCMCNHSSFSFLSPLMGQYVHFTHMQCVLLSVCVCVCVCVWLYYETLELLSAFQPHLNLSILQLKADEGAQGKSSPHDSPLYLHSLAVFVSYISSDERKIKKINNSLFVFILHTCLSWVLIIPQCKQQYLHLFAIYRCFYSFIKSIC